MIKSITPIVTIVAALFASAAMPAAAQEKSGQGASGSYNWLHPRLGIVKVDRATNAIVRPQGAANQYAQGGVHPEQSKYWLDPKGNIRVFRAQVMPQGEAVQSRQ